MNSPAVPVLLGLALVAGAVGINLQQRALQRGDVRDITALRAELDSVRAELSRAAAGADSSRLARSVTDRTMRLEWREFHVPSRQEAIDGWWTLTGPGTILSLVGALLVTLGVVHARRGRGANAPPRDAPS